jgi:lipid-binding SYLF domain-containing protein
VILQGQYLKAQSELKGIKMKNNLNSCYRTLALTFAFLFIAQNLFAASAREIDVSVDVALEKFYKEIPGSQEFTKKAKGVLIFPSVIKAGIGLGAEYGEGAMRIGGKTVDYYNTMTASIGFQLGAQAKSIVMLFMEKAALKEFQNSDGWKAGVDGSVALINLGMGDSLDTTNVKDPIVAFVFGQKGLMYNLTLEGSKYNKIKK